MYLGLQILVHWGVMIYPSIYSYFQVRYDQTLLYIRCQNVVDQTYSFWDPLKSWESLTDSFQVISIPSSHFELLDQPYGKICGLLIMSTALMKYGSLAERKFSPRSNHEKRLIQFLKSSVNVLISSKRGNKIQKYFSTVQGSVYTIPPSRD